MYHLSTDTTGKWNIVGDYKNYPETIRVRAAL